MVADSRWFKVHEMLVTHSGLANVPAAGSEVWDAIADTMTRMDAVRDIVGPITITSGYRSPEVNKAAGGAATSAHLTGHAVDFVALECDVREVCERIAESGIQFDQLIDEASNGRAWTHISFDPRMRGQVLTQRHGKYSPGLV